VLGESAQQRSATRRTPAQSKKRQSEDPLFNSSHISGFIVGAMTGAVASLGIIAGINPTALPQSIISVQETHLKYHRSRALPSLIR
jgi:hypothetical protein